MLYHYHYYENILEDSKDDNPGSTEDDDKKDKDGNTIIYSGKVINIDNKQFIENKYIILQVFLGNYCNMMHISKKNLTNFFSLVYPNVKEVLGELNYVVSDYVVSDHLKQCVSLNQTLDNPKRIVYSTAHVKEFQRKMESQNIYYQVELLSIK